MPQFEFENFSFRSASTGAEGPALSELPPITPKSLLADNYSNEANRRRREIQEVKDARSLTLVRRCSDSRYLLNHQGIYTIPTIGTGGPHDPFSDAYNDPAVKRIVALPHYPCGGLNAKEEQETNGVPNDPEEIDAYIKEHVRNSDPIVQASMSAHEISYRSPDKPVLCAIHNHETGAIIPIAVYKHGRSVLDPSVVAEQFGDFLEGNALYVARRIQEDPGLLERQKIQNPPMMIITDRMKAAEVAYPDTTRRPVFRIRIPRYKSGGGIYITDDDRRTVLRQAQYPVHFSGLEVILVETEVMDKSLEIAHALRARTWMRPWLGKKGNQLLVAQTINGILTALPQQL